MNYTTEIKNNPHSAMQLMLLKINNKITNLYIVLFIFIFYIFISSNKQIDSPAAKNVG